MSETEVGQAPACPPETPAEPQAGETPEPETTPEAPAQTAGQEPVAAEAPQAGVAEAAPEAAVNETPDVAAPTPSETEDTALRSVMEAIVYVTEEPVTPAQIAAALAQPEDRVRQVLGRLAAEFSQPGHGICLREVAGGYKMATKPEHHEAIRAFAKSLQPPLKLSLAALETLATIAYKQPITAPEIMAIRGVQGAGVLKTLLDRKLIATAGRKNVVGRPMLYRTTKEFLVQFGLKDLSELPTLKEFEELRRLAMSEDGPETPAQPAAETAAPSGDPQENA